jgi:hypothetical protein
MEQQKEKSRKRKIKEARRGKTRIAASKMRKDRGVQI